MSTRIFPNSTSDNSDHKEFCDCDVCACDPEETDGGLANLSDGTNSATKKCICDPCDCDLPPLTNSNVQCTCDPCDCQTPPTSTQCTCVPCDCDPPPPSDQCVCEPCECDVQCIPKKHAAPVTFLTQLQRNLNHIQRTRCAEMFPQPIPTVRLNEEVLVKNLLMNESAKPVVVYLPGNQIVPKIVSQRLGDEDMDVLKEFLDNYLAITTVSLPYNNVGDLGISTLGFALHENIEHLNLMNNEIRSDGLFNLCTHLILRKPLQSLRISGNQFGNEGYEGLACLALSGHFPKDIDLSETDMGVEGFQVLIAALAALDTDVDYPPHYGYRGKVLPIDLDVLKKCKQQLNAATRKQDTKIFTDVAAPCYPKRCRNSVSLALSDKTPKDLNASEDYYTHKFLTPEILWKFSNTTFAALFSLHDEESPRVTNDGDKFHLTPSATKTLGDALSNETEIEVDSLIKVLQSERHKKPDLIDTKAYRSIPIITPNMYQIPPFNEEVDNAFLRDTDRPELLTLLGYEKAGEGSSPGQWFQGKLVDPNESIHFGEMKLKPHERDTNISLPQYHPPPIDAHQAVAAAKKFLKEMAQNVARAVACSDYKDEISDVTQLILMTIIEIVYRGQYMRRLRGIPTSLTEKDCKNILEEAVDSVMALVSRRIPNQCNLDESNVKDFIISLFKSNGNTFRNLLFNPYFLGALYHAGTLECHQEVLTKKGAELKGVSTPAAPEILLSLVSTFVGTVIKEAGELIGVSDPLAYRQLSYSEYIGTISDENSSGFPPDDPLITFLENILELSEAIGLDAIMEEKEAQIAKAECLKAASITVDDFFDEIREFVSTSVKFEQIEEVNCYEHLCYRHISRPIRLVLNRPLFHPKEMVIMASLLGNYLKDNCSVKELHLQKWGLDEDGLIAIMEPILSPPNQTLILLDLSNNQIGSDGILLLAEYLKLNPSLKHLVLCQNKLRNPGILPIARVLPETGLETLNIAFNGITEHGLDPFLSQVALSKIYALYLWGNSFGLQTWELFNTLLDSAQIQFTDTFVQWVNGIGPTIVENKNIRSTNHWYEVPPQCIGSKDDLVVPPYLKPPGLRNCKSTTTPMKGHRRICT